MAKKKKTPRNGFYYFMLEVKKSEERNGRHYADMKAISEIASPLWDDLPHEEKKAFNDIAARNKEGESNLANKFTSTGMSFAEQDEEARVHAEALAREKLDISEIVNSLVTEEDFANHPFYVIHVNHLYPRRNGGYALCEFGMVKFSLGGGISNSFHSLLNSGPIELGKRFEAKEWSDQFHRIPIEDAQFDYGPDLTETLFSRVLGFVNGQGGGVIPPFFTMQDNANRNTSLSACKNFFELITGDIGERGEAFRVYHLPKLLYELKHRTSMMKKDEKEKNAFRLHSEALAENEFWKDVYSHARGLGCVFHENLDEGVMYCSLAYAKRWAFYIIQHCSHYPGSKMLPWKHFPEGVEACLHLKAPGKVEDPLHPKAPGKVEDRLHPKAPEKGKARDEKWRVASSTKNGRSPSKGLPQAPVASTSRYQLHSGFRGESQNNEFCSSQKTIPPALPHSSARLVEGSASQQGGYASKMKPAAFPSVVSNWDFPALGTDRGASAFPTLGDSARMGRGRGRGHPLP